MKLDNDKKCNIESVKKQKELRQSVITESLRPNKGHTLFEVNTKTKIVSIAEFEKTDIDWHTALNGDYSKFKKVIKKQDCIYVSALNFDNVKKKLIKRGL